MVRVTSCADSRRRSVRVSIFGLTPGMLDCRAPNRVGPRSSSPITSADHLLASRSNNTRLGHTSEYTSRLATLPPSLISKSIQKIVCALEGYCSHRVTLLCIEAPLPGSDPSRRTKECHDLTPTGPPTGC